MIRNPFKAMVSYFRHSVLGFHSSAEISSQNLENIGVFYTPLFEEYAYSHIKKWRAIAEDWVTVGDVLVVHYEDVMEDRKHEVERMLEHLNIARDSRRLDCLQYADLSLYKRRTKKLTHSPYSRALADTIWENIGHVDRLLVRMGHKGIPYGKYGKECSFDNVNVSWGE